jgi:electron transport complex protein RnfD
MIDPTYYVDPFFHLITGGLMLGAIYMATDMVTSPMSRWGMIVYGIGCGFLTIVIRVFGAYPEGVAFAILIMNGFVPLINRGFKPKRFGEEVKNG